MSTSKLTPESESVAAVGLHAGIQQLSTVGKLLYAGVNLLSAGVKLLSAGVKLSSSGVQLSSGSIQLPSAAKIERSCP
jgi:hypothetical protein